MSFDRTRLPDAINFYEGEGLKLKGRGKWRTTECRFHGGSDSLRINTESGAYVCGAKGGDVLAYRMAAHGEEFIGAAKALGAWIDDDKPAPRKPIPISPRDAITLMLAESNLVAVAAGNVAHGVALTQADLDRVLAAAGRISRIAELFA